MLFLTQHLCPNYRKRIYKNELKLKPSQAMYYTHLLQAVRNPELFLNDLQSRLIRN